MTKSLKRVAITGGAGQIAYNLLFRIASGEMLGLDQPIALQILEIPEALSALEGVIMELQDCAYPLLKEITYGSDPLEVFKEADIALLVGSQPRGPGMDRIDLLKGNGAIFSEQGRALNTVASEDVKVLVVGNPCNTNCLIAMHNAPRIPRKNFHAMTRLDQNRGYTQLANKAGVDVSDVKNLIIWGNHSSTQVPDFYNATINGKKTPEVIEDHQWLKTEFIETVQKRGGQIIKARGKSSAASAANAALDAIKSLVNPTEAQTSFSSGVCSDGNPYGIAEDLIFSFPCRSQGDGNYSIIPSIEWNDDLKQKIQASEAELLQEKAMVEELLQLS